MKDVTDAVERRGGRVVKTLGDGVMSSFESALGALRAAAAVQAAVARLDAEQGGIGLAARSAWRPESRSPTVRTCTGCRW